jgi:hypothetical protein
MNSSIEQSFLEYTQKREEAEKKLKEDSDEQRAVANRLFSTEDGKAYARRMIRACQMLEAGTRALAPDELQRLRAQQDFVNRFITKSVDRGVFIEIIKGI